MCWVWGYPVRRRGTMRARGGGQWFRVGRFRAPCGSLDFLLVRCLDLLMMRNLVTLDYRQYGSPAARSQGCRRHCRSRLPFTPTACRNRESGCSCHCGGGARSGSFCSVRLHAASDLARDPENGESSEPGSLARKLRLARGARQTRPHSNGRMSGCGANTPVACGPMRRASASPAEC